MDTLLSITSDDFYTTINDKDKDVIVLFYIDPIIDIKPNETMLLNVLKKYNDDRLKIVKCHLDNLKDKIFKKLNILNSPTIKLYPAEKKDPIELFNWEDNDFNDYIRFIQEEAHYPLIVR